MKLLKKLKKDISLDQLGSLKSFNKIDSEDKKINYNRQGMIRTVKNAHLIYKRENDISKYNELWQYKSKENGIYYDIDIKNDILSGTDIPLSQTTSADSEQYYEIWSSGNIVFLKIFNLPN